MLDKKTAIVTPGPHRGSARTRRSVLNELQRSRNAKHYQSKCIPGSANVALVTETSCRTAHGRKDVDTAVSASVE